MTRRKESKRCIGQTITPTCFRRYQDIALRLQFFIFLFSLYLRYDQNLGLLAKTAKQGKSRKVSFPGYNKTTRVILNLHHIDRNHGIYHRNFRCDRSNEALQQIPKYK